MTPQQPVRRTDFLMALACATDLATGHSRDFALRSCVLGMRIADVAGLDQQTRRCVWYQALLRYISCNADTHLPASAFGDEIAPRRELASTNMGDKSELRVVFLRAITAPMPVSVPILFGHREPPNNQQNPIRRTKRGPCG
jgi:hypothetical protein